MVKGEDMHSEKEQELYDFVEVKPKTPEDRILLKIHNTITALEGLRADGVAREIPLWGKLKSLKVVGIADELQMKDDGLVLCDTKTRKSPTMPRIAQSRTTQFQLMTYEKLINSIISGTYDPWHLLKHYWKNSNARASEDFIQQHKELGQEFEPNILKAVQRAFTLFQEMPPVKNLTVSYEFQEDGSLIGKDEFSFDSKTFWENIDFCEGFWIGERKAMPVGEYNSWKCNYCEYRQDCQKFQEFSKTLA
jgi:exonuclease V